MLSHTHLAYPTLNSVQTSQYRRGRYQEMFLGREGGVLPAGFVPGVYVIHQVGGAFQRGWLLCRGLGLQILVVGHVEDGGRGRQEVTDAVEWSG